MERAPQSLRAGGERDIYIAIGGGGRGCCGAASLTFGRRMLETAFGYVFMAFGTRGTLRLSHFLSLFKNRFHTYIHYIVFFEIFSTMFVALAYFSFCLHSGEIHFLYRSAS